MDGFLRVFQSWPHDAVAGDENRPRTVLTPAIVAIALAAALVALACWLVSTHAERDCGAFTIGKSAIGSCDRIGG